MALPNELNLDKQSKAAGGVDISPTVRTDNFVFQPSDSWLDTPMTQEFIAGLDPDYISKIDHYKPIINTYAPAS